MVTLPPSLIAVGPAAPHPGGWRDVRLGFGLMLASLIALGPAVLAPPAGRGAQAVAAVFPPWWSAARAAAAAARSAQILRLGGFPSVIVVRTASPDSLRADGAWMFLNPIVAGCASGPSSPLEPGARAPQQGRVP